MEFLPILPTHDFSFPSTAPKRRHVVLTISVIVTVCIILTIVTILVSGDVRRRSRRPLFLIAYLKCGDTYLNGSEKIFPSNEYNQSLMAHASSEAKTRWHIMYQSKDRRTFSMQVELDGHMYCLQDGAPGTGAPWGIAYLGPVSAPIGATIQLTQTSEGYLEATHFPWPGENYKYLSLRDNVLVWTEQKSSRFEMIP